MKSDNAHSTTEYFIGDHTYEIPKDIPFEMWKRIVRDDVPYHFKTHRMSEWDDNDHEEYCNYMMRREIIQSLEEIGEENWNDDHLKWKELARLGCNLYMVRGDYLDILK